MLTGILKDPDASGSRPGSSGRVHFDVSEKPGVNSEVPPDKTVQSEMHSEKLGVSEIPSEEPCEMEVTEEGSGSEKGRAEGDSETEGSEGDTQAESDLDPEKQRVIDMIVRLRDDRRRLKQQARERAEAAHLEAAKRAHLDTEEAKAVEAPVEIETQAPSRDLGKDPAPSTTRAPRWPQVPLVNSWMARIIGLVSKVMGAPPGSPSSSVYLLGCEEGFITPPKLAADPLARTGGAHGDFIVLSRKCSSLFDDEGLLNVLAVEKVWPTRPPRRSDLDPRYFFPCFIDTLERVVGAPFHDIYTRMGAGFVRRCQRLWLDRAPVERMRRLPAAFAHDKAFERFLVRNIGRYFLTSEVRYVNGGFEFVAKAKSETTRQAFSVRPSRWRAFVESVRTSARALVS